MQPAADDTKPGSFNLKFEQGPGPGAAQGHVTAHVVFHSGLLLEVPISASNTTRIVLITCEDASHSDGDSE